jgi:CubicO group peptidase (beta-lactamase class C family)
MGKRSMSAVDGLVEPGFEHVGEVFAESFSVRGDVGAAFAAVVDGRVVVDLWGGVADSASGQRWERDTLQLIFSGTKGLIALCMAMLADRGLLRLEDPVCAYWPEFAAEGKEAITVAEVLSHQARLPGVRTPIGVQDMLDPVAMEQLLAAQLPESDPRGAGFIYHPLTYGWLCDALLRRIDGRSVGRFFAEEVAEPLGLELWIGLPGELESRVSTLEYGPDWGASGYTHPGAFPGDELWASMCENPPLCPPDLGTLWNLPALHAAELPGGNAIGTARSIARLYGALARGGEIDGTRVISSDALAIARRPLASGIRPYTGEMMAFAAGFAIQADDLSFGSPLNAFGHLGMGGSTHGAWPDERVGFSYAMNQMRDDPEGDERATALLDALHACLG